MIGVSVIWYFWAHDRIAGISGLIGQVLSSPFEHDATDRERTKTSTLFLGGLLLTPMFFRALDIPIELAVETPWAVLVPAGFLVGFGTQLARGCTSGHGVCGLSRFSARSAVATAIFMSVAMVVVAIERALS